MIKLKNTVIVSCCLMLLLSGCGNAGNTVTSEEELTEFSETEAVPETIPETEPETEFIWTEPPTDPPAPETVFINCQSVVEVNSNMTVADFVTSANVTLKDETAPVDTGRIGTFEITIPYLYGQETREETFTYQVKDTTPPLILNDGQNAYIKTGEVFDLRELIGYGDNYDTNLTLTYDGDVDTAVPGNYMLSAHLTDSSGNQSTCRLEVTVADEKPSSYSGESVNFADFKKQYASKYNSFAGVDVSSWQGYIDYDALKRAGCEFVIMRIGKSTEGNLVEDSYFEYNFNSAREAGMKVGVYFYSADNDESQIRADADWIAQRLNGEKLDFPIAFDWEDFTEFQHYGINLHDLNLLWNAFNDQMQKNGYESMLYASKFYLQNVWENPDSNTVWLAHYTEQTDYDGNYFIWQRCNTGYVDGIDGYADFDVFIENTESETSASEESTGLPLTDGSENAIIEEN
ncbi:MAG: glycoside hydrolase family 25 [Ruminococcus sp.]|nr:glycoside hydrolase family 25 [Ruminococcus sp.]